MLVIRSLFGSFRALLGYCAPSLLGTLVGNLRIRSQTQGISLLKGDRGGLCVQQRELSRLFVFALATPCTESVFGGGKAGELAPCSSRQRQPTDNETDADKPARPRL